MIIKYYSVDQVSEVR